MKIYSSAIVMREIPDEITLALNISNCPFKCKGCHSQYLQEDIGDELTMDLLDKLIHDNPGISCLCFMGGDSDRESLYDLSTYLKSKYTDLKLAWYSGGSEFDEKVIGVLDYVKLGPYIEELGPLDSPTTNQRLYKLNHHKGKTFRSDITSRFISHN